MPPDLETSLVARPHDAAKPTVIIGWAPLFILPSAVVLLRSQFPAWVLMWLLAVAIFSGLKWVTWWRARTIVPHKAWRSAAYLLAWPGMEADSFLDARCMPPKPSLAQWLYAVIETSFGALLVWVLARLVPGDWGVLQGWVGMMGLIFLLHFGSFQLLAFFWQSVGVVAKPIMDAPLLSQSLSEFWGRRWNLGFRQLAHELIFRPLYRRIGVAATGLLVFVASGLIHDLVISLPARGGYGLPTGYFVLQGIGISVERSFVGKRLGLRAGWPSWVFTATFTAGPAFWLFHPPFVTRVMVPFLHVIRAL